MKSNKRRTGFLILCVAPATILFFIFMVLPTLNVFRMSLFERGAYSPTETFVGLQNFTDPVCGRQVHQGHAEHDTAYRRGHHHNLRHGAGAGRNPHP